MDKHECKLEDLHWSNEPIEIPSGESVSFEVRCRICGKTWHEVYSKNEGLWDEESNCYVGYPSSKYKDMKELLHSLPERE